jgi:hypothetical protein
MAPPGALGGDGSDELADTRGFAGRGGQRADAAKEIDLPRSVPISLSTCFTGRRLRRWGMKRSTAIRHLVEMGEVATEQLRFRNSEIGWPLEEQWVTGELLGGADELDAGTVVLVLDLPAGELPWLAIHPTAEWTGRQLRLGKRPIHWSYRPLAWPVWNHENRRLVRFWTARDGLDTGVIEALQARQLDRLAVVEPSEEELSEQLREELAVSRRHLQEVLDRYWDRDWRREQTRFDESPEDHLWRAATAVEDIRRALDETN